MYAHAKQCCRKLGNAITTFFYRSFHLILLHSKRLLLYAIVFILNWLTLIYVKTVSNKYGEKVIGSIRLFNYHTLIKRNQIRAITKHNVLVFGV